MVPEDSGGEVYSVVPIGLESFGNISILLHVMASDLEIRDVKIAQEGDWQTLSGVVDGELLWFRVPSYVNVRLRSEPFVGAALLEAMITSADIRVEGQLPLSDMLFQALPELQAIYRCWNSDLSLVNIRAALQEPHAGQGVGCYFSAGVDSSYSLLRNRDEITHLILLLGFDGDDGEDTWESRIIRHQNFADRLGKKLIPVGTNAREFARARQIQWDFGHGLCLGTVAHILGLEKVIIPSSHTYEELFPWGSHPLTDPMWSTAVTQIVHHGAGYRRGEKVRQLVGDKEILDNIQVCRHSSSENCGECSKCIRTAIALEMVGAATPALPTVSPDKLIKLPAFDENSSSYLEDAILLAKDCGRKDLYKRLVSYHRRCQIRKMLPEIDRLVFRGLLRSVYHKIVKPSASGIPHRVSMRSKDRWIV